MEKYIADERTGITYELVGDYYLIAGDDEQEIEIGIWGQRHAEYLRKNKNGTYTAPLISGKLGSYLQEIDRQAENMFERLVEQFAEREDVTEKLKSENQMEWVRRMNGIRERVTEIVNKELIYA
jgi:antibiotic biosynthesis monooxygenase (ABM) superfamily enzyme